MSFREELASEYTPRKSKTDEILEQYEREREERCKRDREQGTRELLTDFGFTPDQIRYWECPRGGTVSVVFKIDDDFFMGKELDGWYVVTQETDSGTGYPYWGTHSVWGNKPLESREDLARYFYKKMNK